jgi:hypothetical protein
MRRWYHLSERRYNEALSLSRMYRREASKCGKSRAYLAGCVMAGAALECLLLAMLHIFGDEVDRSNYVAMSRGRPKLLLDWSLANMLRAARGLGWLPAGLAPGAKWSARRAKIGDCAEVLRQLRNLVHPARFLQDYSPGRMTSRYLRQSLDVLDLSVDYLNAKVHASLRVELGIPEDRAADAAAGAGA